MDEIETAIMRILESSDNGATTSQVCDALSEEGLNPGYKKVYRKMLSLSKYSYLDYTKELQSDGGGYQLRFTVKGASA